LTGFQNLTQDVDQELKGKVMSISPYCDFTACQQSIGISVTVNAFKRRRSFQSSIDSVEMFVIIAPLFFQKG
jgi:hypothetical protein